MKKIMLIDGSLRKNMNTAAMLDSFGKGVKSVSDDIEVRHIHLYDYQFHGCYSCMGCKLKDKPVEHCVFKDGIIYTMNATEQYMPMIESMCNMAEMGIEVTLTKPERILMFNTVQVKDYSRYEFSEETAIEKAQYKAEHYDADMQKAFDAGRSMAEKVMQSL